MNRIVLGFAVLTTLAAPAVLAAQMPERLDADPDMPRKMPWQTIITTSAAIQYPAFTLRL